MATFICFIIFVGMLFGPVLFLMLRSEISWYNEKCFIGSLYNTL